MKIIKRTINFLDSDAGAMVIAVTLPFIAIAIYGLVVHISEKRIAKLQNKKDGK
jgi:hypothetical protein